MRKIFTSVGIGLKAYLSFNYAERRGIIVLVMLILVIEGINAFLPAMSTAESNDFTDFQQELMLFEAQLNRPDTSRKKSVKSKSQNNFQPSYKNYRPAPAVRQLKMLELNSADSLALLELHGIGPSFARRIIKYRGMLGGFYEEAQLLEVYGMDSARLEMFREQLIINTDSIRRLNINQASFKELLKHPYLDYETVKDIVNYRDRTSPINHPDTLKSIIGYEPMFEKIRHYVEY